MCKRNNIKKSAHQYHALTPVNNVECDVYLDALQEALLNKDIKNIAVTGPYGSGKSSVIRTFFAKRNENGQYKPITITLANFDTSALGKKGEEETDSVRAKIYGEKLEQLIERSIVQQLFYHEKDENLPESHFKKIRKEAWWKKILGTFHILLIILSAVILLFSEKFWDLPLLKEASEQCQNIIFIAAWFYAFFGGLTIIYVIRKLMLQVSAMKFRVENAEIELNKNANKSILNHYLDEIIYFFEETGKNVVILEDLDRFEHYEIFTKLREINYLINNCEKISQKQKVVFIYALRDDIFKDTERTKFFDFILPILPVINYSNSGEILRRELPVKPKAKIKDNSIEIAEELIDDVSLFIDDMRLIYNIVNEYKIYSGVLSKSKLIANRLFAIIVYKNLYPQDFVKLGQNKGELYDIIVEKKTPYQEKIIKQYQAQIAEKQARIKTIETSDRTLLEKELRLVYLNQIINHLSGTFVRFIIDKQTKKTHEVAEDPELFEKLITQKKLGYRHMMKNYTGYFVEQDTSKDDFSFNEIEKEVNPNLTYEQRKALLLKTELDRLKQEIKGLEHNIEECKQWTICDLLNHGILKVETEKKSNKEETTEKESFKKQLDFIKIALSNDYINENYWEYISIFHEGSLTPSDKEFVLNAKVHRDTPYNHPLNRRDNVLKALTKEHSTRLLGEIYALNNDLMDYILSETSELYTAPYLRAAIQKRDFIFQYIDRGIHLDLFINQICARWHQFWNYICEHKPDEINKYLRLILENTLVENIVPIFKNNKEYINRYADFMLINIDEQKKHDLIDELNLRFEEINPETLSEDKKYIYETWAFALLPNVIPVILSAFPQWDEHMYNTRNYSYIKEAYPKLFEYIQNNIEEYIDKVFLPLEKNTDISQEDFAELLNNENITNDQKKKIIAQCNVKIEDVSIVNSIDLRGDICRQNKMLAKWENIRVILNSPETNLSEQCIAFLNIIENAEALSEQKLTDELDVFDNSDKTTLSYTIIHFADITIEAYKLLIKAFIGSYSSFIKDALTEEKMRLLIDNQLVAANKIAYQYLKENFCGLHIYMLYKHGDNLQNIYSELKFDATDIQCIADSYIGILNDGDIIVQKAADYLKKEPENLSVSSKLIQYLCSTAQLFIEDRIDLYVKYCEYVENQEAFLASLHEPYSKILNTQLRATIPHTERNKQLLEILKKKKIVANYSDRASYYQVYHKLHE